MSLKILTVQQYVQYSIEVPSQQITIKETDHLIICVNYYKIIIF